MAKKAKVGKRSIVRTKVCMRAQVAVCLGDTMLFPFSIEVSAGPPSHYRTFHGKYHGQKCVVVGIGKASELRPGGASGNERVLFKVQFADGVKQELSSNALVYVRKKSRQKKKQK